MTNSSNSYFDTDFQVGEYDSNTIWAMVKKNLTTRDVNSFKTSLTLSKHFSFQTWDLWQAEQYFWMLPFNLKKTTSKLFHGFCQNLKILVRWGWIQYRDEEALTDKAVVVWKRWFSPLCNRKTDQQYIKTYCIRENLQKPTRC